MACWNNFQDSVITFFVWYVRYDRTAERLRHTAAHVASDMTNPRNRRRIGLSESSTNTSRQHNTLCSSSSTRRKSYIHRPRAFYPHRFAAAASAATFDEEVYPILGTPPRLLAMARKTKAGEGDPFDDLATNTCTDTLVRQIESLRRRNTKLLVARRIDAEKKKAANVEQMLREERKKNIEMTVCALDRYTFGS